MKAGHFIYLIAIFVVLVFSWWFYSLFRLSSSNYRSDKALLDARYTMAREDFFERAARNEFKSERGILCHWQGQPIVIDTTLVRTYFKTHFPDVTAACNTQLLVSDSLSLETNKDVKILELKKKFERKERMWVAEGISFFAMLLLGFLVVLRSTAQSAAAENQQRNFLLSVTHEFKTPIASIKLYLQTMQRRQLSKEQTDMMISNSLKDIERLNELSENVLVATKIESKGYPYVFDWIDFSALLKEEVDKFIHLKKDTHIFSCQITPEIKIFGDRFTLTLVITNLIENACKYSPSGSTVSIALYKDTEVHLRVADEGDGIKEEERDNIFKKFYRIGNENTRKTKGTGLGLYIVKEVSKKHNADITISGNTPKGSIFEITFEN